MNFLPARLVRRGEGLAVDCGGEAVLALPAERQAGLAEGPVVLGLRPEHITGASHAASGNASGRREGLVPLAVTIDLVQPTGTRLYGAFALAGTEVLAELQAHDVERPGETIEVLVDMTRAILIDPDSERVL